MTNNKNRQAVAKFSRQVDKSDEVIIHNIQRYLREKHQWRAIIEPYLIFKSFDGSYMGYNMSFSVNQLKGMDIRHPDLFLPERNLIIEIDGKIHSIKVTDTEKRNHMYFVAGLGLIVLDLEEIKMFHKNIYSELEKKIDAL